MSEDPSLAVDAGPEALWSDVLRALRSGRDAGADALWGALTPSARAPLGDPAGARRSLERGLLAPLVGHVEAATADWERRGDAARTEVAVLGGDGGPAAYVVSARRGSDGVWRISGLRRDDLPLG